MVHSFTTNQHDQSSTLCGCVYILYFHFPVIVLLCCETDSPLVKEIGCEGTTIFNKRFNVH